MRVLLFVKYPHPGQVKTRLAARIGTEHASGLYRAFVRDQLETLRQAGLDPVICCAPNAPLAEYRVWLGAARTYVVQRGEDLGLRMAEALRAALGVDTPVVLIGSDLPDLPAAHLLAARQALENADICLGPTPDGGFYLIGLRTPDPLPGIFADVRWSTDQVLTQTLTNCRKLGHAPRLLPPWSDVDTARDLSAFAVRNMHARSFSMDYLRAHGLLPSAMSYMSKRQ